MSIFQERGNKFFRSADSFIGIGLIFIFRILKKKIKKIPNHINIKKIAILKSSAIGDTVLLSAAIKDLKNCLPESEIFFFCGKSNFEAVKLIGNHLHIIKLAVTRPLKAIKAIRENHFDLFIDTDSWPRINAIYSFLSKSDFTLGFKTPGQFRHYLYDKSIEHKADCHEYINYSSLVQAAGCKAVSKPQLEIIHQNTPEKYIVLHMFPGGSKSHLKEWPEENWIKVIEYISSLKKYKLYLTGAGTDADKAEKIIKKFTQDINISSVAGKQSLQETTSLLKSAELLITVNTGIMHIASAINCNLIGLHGPTSVLRWGPINNKAIALSSKLTCSPCLNLGAEYKCNVNNCMQSIKVEEVIEAINRFLKK